jgi:UDP-GlcNAc:undecaprenyl-phosphate GlcNAc-1-phosphate transferase
VNLWLLAAVLVGGTVISALTVWLSIGLAHRIGAHDHPDGGRKTQERPIPKLGGLAVAVAFAAVAIVGLLGLGRPDTLALALAALLPALGGALVGYVDDLKHLPPLVRLSLQGLLGVLAWALGTRVSVSGNEIVDLVLTVSFFMIVVNGINLLDNSDGLAAGTVLVSSLGAGVIAVLYGQELVSLLGFALVGVCFGYLWHNWHPARVYLGDSGAYFLGFMLATLVIRLTPSSASAAAGVAIALLLVALPIVDTSYVVITRLRAGVHPFTAGRDHLAHVLQDRGRSVQASVLVLQGLLAVSTILAVGIAALQLNRLG